MFSLSSMSVRFDLLEEWTPSIPTTENVVMSREEVLSSIPNLGMIGYTLQQCEQGEKQDKIINIIQHLQSKGAPLTSAFEKALSVSDRLSLCRRLIEPSGCNIAPEVSFHGILLEAVCKNLDQPTFGKIGAAMQMNIRYNLDEMHKNRIRRFLFDPVTDATKKPNKELGLILLEVIRDDEIPALQAPERSVSYGEDRESGPIVPVRYGHFKKEHAKKYGSMFAQWMQEKKNTWVVKGDQMSEGEFRCLLSMLTNARSKVVEGSEGADDDFFQESYLYVIDPSIPKTSVGILKCSKPSCENHSTKKCSVCFAPYCSRECQKKDWADGHKQVCEKVKAGRKGKR